METENELIGDQLRQKIVGKFQITSTLAGFCFTTISVQLTFLFQPQVPRLLPQSVGTMFFSLILYSWGLYRLDGLTMPKRFWCRSFESPPSGDGSWVLTEDNLWSLKRRMVIYWLAFTVAAVGLTALSLLLMLAPLPTIASDASHVTRHAFYWACGTITTAVIYCAMWRFWEWQKEKRDQKFGRLLRFVD